jgi:hypothetical protein
MKSVNENSAHTIVTRFFDEQNQPTTPTTARWRLFDVTNNRIITDWADMTPATAITIVIPASSNAIYRDNVTRQEQAFMVQSDTDLPTQFTSEEHYYVRNLSATR